jgi:hypothetical protein
MKTLRSLWEAVKATPGYWVNRFQKFATEVERNEKAGKFGKWPWQEDYGLWPWQRRRKGNG